MFVNAIREEVKQVDRPLKSGLLGKVIGLMEIQFLCLGSKWSGLIISLDALK